MSELESIKEWLDDIEITFTTGTANLNWKSIMNTVKEDPRFYLDTDEDGESKPAGWEFLRMDGSDDDDDEESEESAYSEASGSDDDDSGSDESDWGSIVDEDESSEEE